MSFAGFSGRPSGSPRSGRTRRRRRRRRRTRPWPPHSAARRDGHGRSTPTTRCSRPPRRQYCRRPAPAVARAGRRNRGAPDASWTGWRTALKDGTVIHLASLGPTDAEPRLGGADDPAFAELRVKGQVCRRTGRRPGGHAAGRGMEFELAGLRGSLVMTNCSGSEAPSLCKVSESRSRRYRAITPLALPEDRLRSFRVRGSLPQC